jgi:hypothetical protein
MILYGKNPSKMLACQVAKAPGTHLARFEPAQFEGATEAADPARAFPQTTIILKDVYQPSGVRARMTEGSRVANSASNDAVLTAQVLDHEGSTIHEAAHCGGHRVAAASSPSAVINRKRVT